MPGSLWGLTNLISADELYCTFWGWQIVILRFNGCSVKNIASKYCCSFLVRTVLLNAYWHKQATWGFMQVGLDKLSFS
jgi:hypothetical protein